MQDIVVDQEQEKLYPVRHINNYLSDSRTILSLILLLNGCVIAGIIFLCSIVFVKAPTPRGFQLNEQMQIIPLIPLNKQGITQAALNNWVGEFSQIAFNFNYSNQNKATELLKDYMDDKALDAYTKLFNTDNILSKVFQDKTIISMLAVSAPMVVSDGIIQDRYAWKIRMEIELTSSSFVRKIAQNKILEILVWRVPSNESPLGIKIVRLDLKNN